MKILAVETSGKTFSAALNEDGKTLASFIYDCGHIHSEMLIPAMEKILKDTGNTHQSIDRFAVSTGPGSFTGIRVGMTAVKTMAQALNKPVVAIDALSILEKSFIDCFQQICCGESSSCHPARSRRVYKLIDSATSRRMTSDAAQFCCAENRLVAAIDALRNEIYVKNKGAIVIKHIDDFIKENKKHKNKIIVIGNASSVYKEKLEKNLGKPSVCLPPDFNIPKAQVLALIAQYEKPKKYSEIEPLYIRRSWAEEKAENR